MKRVKGRDDIWAEGKYQIVMMDSNGKKSRFAIYTHDEETYLFRILIEAKDVDTARAIYDKYEEAWKKKEEE